MGRATANPPLQFKEINELALVNQHFSKPLYVGDFSCLGR